jgi:hypothetical protein
LGVPYLCGSPLWAQAVRAFLVRGVLEKELIMSTTHRLAAALASVAVAACAHVNTQSSAASSYPGGRAGQPGSWNVSAQTAAVEQARQQVVWNEPWLGGRSAQPASWIHSGMEPPASPAPSYCYLGGRDAQPSSGPALLREHKQSAPTPVCEDSRTAVIRM